MSMVEAPAHWVYDDGGRAETGYQGIAGDCVTRAISVAAEIPYQEVYDELMIRQGIFFSTKRGEMYGRTRGGHRRSSSPRNGVFHHVYVPYLTIALGWQWTPMMGIGTGTTVHLRADELPGGRIIARLSKHLTAVIDGVVHDTVDPSRDGTRCVYGIWTAPE